MSGTIKLRSPYYVKTTPTANAHYVAIGLKMWQGGVTSPPSSFTYNLVKFVVDNQDFVIFEVTSLARDYLRITFDGSYNGDLGLWLRYDYTIYDNTNTSLLSFGETRECSDGYTEFKDGLNYISNGLEHYMQTNTCLQIPRNEKTCVPVNAIYTEFVKFYNDGELVKNVGQFPAYGGTGIISNVCYEVPADDYYDRITNLGPDNHVIRNVCTDAFFGAVDYGAVDTIVVESYDPNDRTSISVERVDECKYPIHKLTFVNKFGALQDLYMFKNSVETMRVKDTTFKRNLLVESDFSYNTTEHQKRTIHKEGNKSITLASGYIGECLVPAYEELFLSEQVWLTELATSDIYPVYLSDKSLEYKTHLNDKLIEYKLAFEYAFDQVNNIR